MNNHTIYMLLHCLEREKFIYQQYYELSCNKRELILKSDIGQLDMLLEKEKLLSKEISMLEEKRHELLWRITKNKNITITELLSLIEDKTLKGQMNTLFLELRGILKKNKQINQINMKLIQENLNYIKFMLNSVMEEEHTYGLNGAENNATQKINIFDQRV